MVAVGVHLHGPVPAEKEVGEEDRHLGHQRVTPQVPGSDREGGHQVLPAIRPQLRDRPLRSGQHDGDVDALQQEAQRGCRVRHRVGAVQHHDPGVSRRVGDDGVGDVDPVRRAHRRRVDGVGERRDGQGEGQPAKERQVVPDLPQVERHERAGRVRSHAEGATGVEDEDGRPLRPHPAENLESAHRPTPATGSGAGAASDGSCTVRACQ